jgi:DNA-directed RNA polymerase sigma subunit (sigma70/sigma32)
MGEGTYKRSWWFEDGPMVGRTPLPDWEAAQDEIIDQIEGAKAFAIDVLAFLGDLTNKQRFVIERRYGVSDGYVYSLDELGSAMGISRQAVQQIEATAIRRLQKLAGPLTKPSYKSTPIDFTTWTDSDA